MAQFQRMNPQEELDRLKSWSISEVCKYLATKVRKHRLDAKVSQVEFAKQAGIPLRTYKRFESHGRANLETFVEVLRAIDRTHYLLLLFPVKGRTVVGPTLEDKLRTARLRAHAKA